MALVAFTAEVLAGEPGEFKEREAELAIAKRDPVRLRQVIAGAQMALGALGFGTGPFDGALDVKTKKALLKFQHLHQLPPTGELDARTSVELDADLDALFYSEAATPSLSVNLQLWASGYVSAEGTWLPAGVSFTCFPQTTVLHCYKDLQTCVAATTVLSDLASDKYLSTRVTPHRIERWDEHEIRTRATESGACDRYTMRVARDLESVTRSLFRVAGDAFCKELSKDLGDEVEFKLVGGDEVRQRRIGDRKGRLKGILQAPGLTGTR